MHRVLAGCLLATVTLTLTAFAQGSNQSSSGSAEKKAERLRPVRRYIRGNQGFHYGQGYNVYRMHIPAAPAGEKK